jgi:UDP-GlcNAc3NAcA epimerase
VDGLCELARELPIVLPLHPRTRHALEREGLLSRLTQTVQLLRPLGYLDMMALTLSASLVITDSGGVQKEAAFAGRPCMILRASTEWTELLDAGHQCVDDRPELIVQIGSRLLNSPFAEQLSWGSGRAAEDMLDLLLARYGGSM